MNYEDAWNLSELKRVTERPNFDSIYLAAFISVETGTITWDCDIRIKENECARCGWGAIQTIEGNGDTPNKAITKALENLAKYDEEQDG